MIKFPIVNRFPSFKVLVHKSPILNFISRTTNGFQILPKFFPFSPSFLQINPCAWKTRTSTGCRRGKRLTFPAALTLTPRRTPSPGLLTPPAGVWTSHGTLLRTKAPLAFYITRPRVKWTMALCFVWLEM